MEDNKTSLSPMFIESCKRVIGAMSIYSSNAEGFWRLFDEMRSLFPQVVLAENSDVWVLHYRVLQVIDAAERYDNRGNARLDEHPTELFAALHGVKTEMEVPFLQGRDYRPAQSIQQLRSENVPDFQICMEWGLVDSEGRIRLELLNREVDVPGSVINANWKHPRQIKIEQQRLEYREDYENLLESHFGKGNDPMAMPAPPETAEQLYLEGVEAWQAAKILGKTEAEMLADYDTFAKTLAEPNRVKVTGRDGREVPEYKPSHYMAEEAKIDSRYETSTELMDAEEVKAKTGWDRDLAAAKYADWTVAKLKEHCRANEIAIRGNLSAEKLIERILDFDQQAVEAAYLVNA